MSRWAIEFTFGGDKAFDRLDGSIQARLMAALERLAQAPDPQALCKPLRGSLKGDWRYRVGDWRVIVRFERQRVVIVVVDAGPRGSVYD